MLNHITVEIDLEELLNVKLHDQSVREFMMGKLSLEAWANGPVHRNECNLHHFENIVIGLLWGSRVRVQLTADVVRNESEHGHL